MNAILTKTLKSGSKQIFGQVLRRGMGTITLCINQKDGNKSIKTFKESDYTVKTYE